MDILFATKEPVPIGKARPRSFMPDYGDEACVIEMAWAIPA